MISIPVRLGVSSTVLCACSARARPVTERAAWMVGWMDGWRYITFFLPASQSQSSVFAITPTSPLDSQVVRLPLLVTGQASHVFPVEFSAMQGQVPTGVLP